MNYEGMVVFGKNMSNFEKCKRDLKKRFAVVRIRLASNTVTVINRGKRVTFTGHIANLGNEPAYQFFFGKSLKSKV